MARVKLQSSLITSWIPVYLGILKFVILSHCILWSNNIVQSKLILSKTRLFKHTVKLVKTAGITLQADGQFYDIFLICLVYHFNGSKQTEEKCKDNSLWLCLLPLPFIKDLKQNLSLRIRGTSLLCYRLRSVAHLDCIPHCSTTEIKATERKSQPNFQGGE